jgi:hypothetical protein
MACRVASADADYLAYAQAIARSRLIDRGEAIEPDRLWIGCRHVVQWWRWIPRSRHVFLTRSHNVLVLWL